MPTIATDLLDIAFRDTGLREGVPVLLLHGWPDDAAAWDGVADRLNAAGHRTIVPTLRGFTGTRFLSDETPRTGDSARLALDAAALLDALGIERVHVAGHDWGANAAEALAIGYPERVRTLAMLATPPRTGGMPTPSFAQAQRYWYHWFMATQRGAAAVAADPIGFARVHWENWGSPGWFDEAEFERTAASWNNPDFVPVTLHSYRSRWDEAAPDASSAWLAEKVAATPRLTLPAAFVWGEADGVTAPPSAHAAAAKFGGPFRFVSVPGVGHFVPREAPDRVAEVLLALIAGEAPGRDGFEGE
jgi:pimeloyl-ACP methyl ester carboxylesterase